MKIYKTLEQTKDDFIRIGDLIDYCNRCADTCRKMADNSLKRYEETMQDYMLNAVAYFQQEERKYRHDLPDIVIGMINKPLQTDEDREEGNEQE